MNDALIYKDGYFPALCSKADLTSLCLHAVDNGAYELRLVSGELPWAATPVGLSPMSHRVLTYNEMKMLVSTVFTDSAFGKVVSGEPDNQSFAAIRDRDSRERFRVNISAGYRKGDAIMMVMRYIPQEIPSLDAIGMPEDIVEHVMSLKRGVVMFVGATGTGKSTSLASIIQHRLENRDSETFITAEEPIEFTYDKSKASVFQMEVGRHIESFPASIRNFLRQNPTMFLLGEARDSTTIDMALRAGLVGPLVFTTGHANDIASTIPRLIGEYPRSERDTALETVITGLNMIVSQTLVLSADKASRVALRETLIVDNAVRKRLREATVDTVGEVVRELLPKHGRPMSYAASEALSRGSITEDTYREVCRNYG